MQVLKAVDRAAAAAAQGLLSWSAKRLGPPRREWIEAVRAELDVIDGGAAQLWWAVGGLRSIWVRRTLSARDLRSVRPRASWRDLALAVVLAVSLVILGNALPNMLHW